MGAGAGHDEISRYFAEELNIGQNVSFSVLRKRLFAVSMAIAFLFCIFLSRFFYVQVIFRDKLMLRALDQWTREIPVVAERGNIYDRNGVLLAGNEAAYTVYARANAVQDALGCAETLSSLLESPYEEILKKLKDKSASEITIAKRITKEQAEKIEGYALTGVYYAKDGKRVYPYRELACQVLGFTSYDGSGVTGVERYYNTYLKGTDGEIRYETDLVGVGLEGTGAAYLAAENGSDVVLTLDYRIQALTEEVMGRVLEETNAVAARAVILDPQDFSLLAMVNLPSYDLNEIPRNDLDLLNSRSRNSIMSDIYEPGSTFKIITAAANIEEYCNGNENAFSVTHIFSSARTRTVDGSRIRCWSNHENGRHAGLNLAGALNNSCNPCFVDIVLSLGKETFYRYLHRFGFGTATGADFPGEAVGLLLAEGTLKNADLARIGFGQAVAVTPIQLAAAAASAINGGYYYTPHIVKEIRSGDEVVLSVSRQLRGRTVSEETSRILSSMLEGVVSEGSGKNAFIEGYRVAGKTGTAQKYENGAVAQGKYISSFLGYFPSDNPRFLALVIVDEPQGSYYGSTVAAPCAKEIFEGIIQIMQIQPSEV